MSPKASSLTAEGNLQFLFKGPFGFGKTLAAASFALNGPTYIAYFDKKKPIELLMYFTEKRFGKKAQQIMDNIDYDIYGGPNCHEYLNKIIEFAKQGCKYENFITDSLTNLTASAVNWSLGFRTPGGKKDPKNSTAAAILPDFDEYKIETSMISQALDISKELPCNVIWTAHPLPQTRIEGSGASMTVTKTNSLVTYGSKVAGMVPGNFTEIYHFSQKSNYSEGGVSKRYVAHLDAIGDEFAKSPILSDYTKELDFTNKLFYEVWKEAVDKSRGIESKSVESKEESNLVSPFANNQSKWKV